VINTVCFYFNYNYYECMYVFLSYIKVGWKPNIHSYIITYIITHKKIQHVNRTCIKLPPPFALMRYIWTAYRNFISLISPSRYQSCVCLLSIHDFIKKVSPVAINCVCVTAKADKIRHWVNKFILIYTEKWQTLL